PLERQASAGECAPIVPGGPIRYDREARPRSSEDRAPASGAGGAGSSPAGGTSDAVGAWGRAVLVPSLRIGRPDWRGTRRRRGRGVLRAGGLEGGAGEVHTDQPAPAPECAISCAGSH